MQGEIQEIKPKAKKPRKKAVKKPKKIAVKIDAGLKSTKTEMPSANFLELKQPERKQVKKEKAIKPFSLYKKIAYSFIILTILLLSAVFYFSFSRVSIAIVPNQENISGQLTVDVYDKEKGVAQEGGNSIEGVVKQFAIEQTKTFESSGREVLGQDVTGKIIVYNKYTKAQPLVATTRFLSADHKLFRLKNTVSVPAGGQVEAEIYADEPSQDMAVAPGRFTIPGLWAGLQDKIYGESKDTMQYEQNVKLKIEQADIDKAVNELKDSLLARAKEEIGGIYGDYSQIIYQIDNNSITQQLDGKVGEEKNKFTANMKAMVTVVAFQDDQVFSLAQQNLSSSLPDDKKLVGFEKKDLNLNLTSANVEDGSAVINASFVGKMALKDNAGVIEREKLAGLNKNELAGYLDSIPEISSYEVKFFPSFMKKVPKLVDKINIEIKEQ